MGCRKMQKWKLKCENFPSKIFYWLENSKKKIEKILKNIGKFPRLRKLPKIGNKYCKFQIKTILMAKKLPKLVEKPP